MDRIILSDKLLVAIAEARLSSATRAKLCGDAATHICCSLLPKLGMSWPSVIVCDHALSFGLLAIDCALLTPVVTVGAWELSESLPKLKRDGALFDYVLDGQSGFCPDHFDGGFQFAEVDKSSNTMNLTPIVERYDLIMAQCGLREPGMPDCLLRGEYNIEVNLSDLETYFSQ